MVVGVGKGVRRGREVGGGGTICFIVVVQSQSEVSSIVVVS